MTTKRGITTTTGGNICTIRSETPNRFLPRKSMRARAYAPPEPASTTRREVDRDTMRLFRKYRRNGRVGDVTARTKLSKVRASGHSVACNERAAASGGQAIH